MSISGGPFQLRSALDRGAAPGAGAARALDRPALRRTGAGFASPFAAATRPTRSPSCSSSSSPPSVMPPLLHRLAGQSQAAAVRSSLLYLIAAFGLFLGGDPGPVAALGGRSGGAPPARRDRLRRRRHLHRMAARQPRGGVRPRGRRRHRARSRRRGPPSRAGAGRRTAGSSRPRSPPARSSPSWRSTTSGGRSSGTTSRTAPSSSTPTTCASTSRSPSTSRSWATTASTPASVLAYAEDHRGGSLDSLGMQELRGLGDHRVRRVREIEDEIRAVRDRFTDGALDRVQERHELLPGCHGTGIPFHPHRSRRERHPRLGLLRATAAWRTPRRPRGC